MIDERKIREWWDVFKTDCPLTEFRILGRGKTFSGYFTDIEKAIPFLRKYDGYGIYATFNEVKESCYGRTQCDQIVDRPKSTTNDNDIERRRYILIDFDPERPSDTNASDEEKQTAMDRMKQVGAFLRKEGFNYPVIADSGNGFHLYYKVDIPNDKESTDTIRDFLLALDALFSDEKVKVDTSVFNASRIAKVMGTSSNKGSSTKSRPQRNSGILYKPNPFSVNDIALVRKVAELYPKPEAPSSFNGYSTERFDLEGFIQSHGIKVIKRSRFSGGEKLVLEECPFDHNHKDAAILHLDNGAIAYKCFHNSCSHYGWRDFRIHFDPTAYSRADYDEYRHKRDYYGTKAPKAFAPVKEDSRGKKWLDMTDIPYVDISELPRIPSGFEKLDKKTGGFFLGDVTIVSGLSGAGKSTILNQFALNAIQRGYKVAAWSGELQGFRFRSWLDQMAAGKDLVKPRPGIEDSWYCPKNVQEEIHKWLTGKFILYNNDYGAEWNNLRADVEEVIKNNGVQLVLLDNLMALDLDGPSSDNDLQTRLIKDLKELAKRENIHIVLVCHPRKEQSFQLLRKESIAGTANLTNLCDNLVILHRVGRDFEKRANDFFGADKVQKLLEFDTVMEVAKNRSEGVVDLLIGLYYEKETRRMKNEQAENIIYGWRETPTEAPIFTEPLEDMPDEVWYNK